jgi:hypothetical protein
MKCFRRGRRARVTEPAVAQIFNVEDTFLLLVIDYGGESGIYRVLQFTFMLPEGKQGGRLDDCNNRKSSTILMVWWRQEVSGFKEMGFIEKSTGLTP